MSLTHDALIFGGGLAGTILADHMIRSGKRPLLISEARFSRCSRIAAGLINPISGKRLNLAWNADTFIPYSKNYYQALDNEFGIRVFHTRQIARLFASDEEARIWAKKQNHPEYQAWIDRLTSLPIADELGWDEEQGIAIKGGGYVDTSRVLNRISKKLESLDAQLTSPFNYSELSVNSESVSWKQYRAPYAIFSEGHLATRNPWFPGIPYKPAKGVIGRIATNAPLRETAIMKGYFIIPRHGSTYYVGATYDWENRDDIPDEKSIADLTAFLHKELPYRWSWDTLDAGVRPATAGAKPVIGPSSIVNRIYSFNGFGSKGCMQIPYLASLLVEHLFEDANLPPEILPSRFEKANQAEPKRWRATEIARDAVLEVLKPGGIAVDATAGNGHDTLWLAQAIGENGKVFAFDIQKDAIESASQRIKEADLANRVEFNHRSHASFSKSLSPELKGQLSAIVFNLGYLPGGNHSLITKPDTTLAALDQSLSWLKPGGILSIVLYPAHPGGEEEANAVRNWIEDLSPSEFTLMERQHPTGRTDSPVPVIVQKRS